MKAARLFTRWQKRRRALDRELPCLVTRVRRRGRTEDIHQVRVTARKLRLFNRIAPGSPARKAARGFRDWSRGVATATDAVRDLDVTLEWLAEQTDAETVVRAVTARRAACLRSVRQELRPFPPQLSLAVDRPDAKGRPARRLRRRLRRLRDRLIQRAREDADRFFDLAPEDQHDFRRGIRRWRYLRELEVPARRLESDRLFQRLLSLQGVLGDRQNLHLVELTLHRLDSTPDVRRLAMQARRAGGRLRSRLRKELAWLKA